MTEQQIDAELSRYEPDEVTDAWGSEFYWEHCHMPAELFMRLRGGVYFGGSEDRSEYRRYPTREAAFADLRRAIALTGTNAGS